MRAIATTVPFGSADPRPIDLMQSAGLHFDINPLNRKLRGHEVSDVIADYEIVIAGTEPITADIIAACPKLKAICRVGIGLDSVDLEAAKKRGIIVTYTPDSPSPAVSELTVGLMLNLLRHVTKADRHLRHVGWKRFMGRRISDSVIGVIGTGRIGQMVIDHLRYGFPGVKILMNDLVPIRHLESERIATADKETIYRESDVITLHIPLTPETKHMITARELAMMKPGAILINTARGGIIDEADLAKSLRTGHLGAAGIDVFDEEPYQGELRNIDSALLTCHMGSMSSDCRARMEIEATEEAIRIFRGTPPLNRAPE